jgi:hypothetical protein
MRTLTRPLIPLLLGALLLACGGSPDPGGPVETPYAAPDFSRPDINPYSPTTGQTRTLSEQSGKVVLLYFALFT